MKRFKIAVCDENESYLQHLEVYLREQENLPFQPEVFTEYKSFTACREREHFDLVIASEGFLPEGEQKAEGVILLTEEPADGGFYRYRSADAFVRDVTESLGRIKSSSGEAFVPYGEKMKLVGFYAPEGGRGQTLAALGLGELLAESHRVLYLNLRPHAGFEELLGRRYREDLAELLYYGANLPAEFFAHLLEVKEELHGLEYLPPVFCHQDLLRMEGKDWENLFRLIEEGGIYEYIILDLSDSLQGLFEIMESCTKVYTVLGKSKASEAAFAHYKRVLTEFGYQDIENKTCRCFLPEGMPEEPEELLTRGRFGEWLRHISKDLWKEEAWKNRKF